MTLPPTSQSPNPQHRDRAGAKLGARSQHRQEQGGVRPLSRQVSATEGDGERRLDRFGFAS